MNAWAKEVAGVPDFQRQLLKLTDKPHHCGLVILMTDFDVVCKDKVDAFHNQPNGQNAETQFTSKQTLEKMENFLPLPKQFCQMKVLCKCC